MYVSYNIIIPEIHSFVTGNSDRISATVIFTSHKYMNILQQELYFRILGGALENTPVPR